MPSAKISIRSFWRYEIAMLRLAGSETLDEIRSRTREAGVTVIAGLLGALRGSQQGGLLEVIVSAAIGAMAGAVLVFLWNLVTSPARIQHQNEQALAETTAQVARLLTPPGAAFQGIRLAIHDLSDAHRNLRDSTLGEPVDGLWRVFEERLDAYDEAVTLYPLISIDFHDELRGALRYWAERREISRLQRPMGELTDILLHGDFDLDVVLSAVEPRVLTSKSGRDRFVVFNVTVANREPTPVSLAPLWRLELESGRVHMEWEPDAEPLVEYDQYRRDFPRAAFPALPMPLRLEPRGASVGYWAFFVGSSLESSVLATQPERKWVDAVLEIRDLPTGRRTKSMKLAMTAEFLTPLMSPPLS